MRKIEKEDWYNTTVEQLKKTLSGKYRDVSNWLTELSINDFGFELSKQNFRDAIWLRYGWSNANVPTTCPLW